MVAGKDAKTEVGCRRYRCDVTLYSTTHTLFPQEPLHGMGNDKSRRPAKWISDARQQASGRLAIAE